jgi:hypothetical protein
MANTALYLSAITSLFLITGSPTAKSWTTRGVQPFGNASDSTNDHSSVYLPSAEQKNDGLPDAFGTRLFYVRHPDPVPGTTQTEKAKALGFNDYATYQESASRCIKLFAELYPIDKSTYTAHCSYDLGWEFLGVADAGTDCIRSLDNKLRENAEQRLAEAKKKNEEFAFLDPRRDTDATMWGRTFVEVWQLNQCERLRRHQGIID